MQLKLTTINEAARFETLTKTFATPIVGSEEFTAYCREREALGSESLARGQRSHDRVPIDPDGASDAETVVLLSRHSRPSAAVRRRPSAGECRTWGSVADVVAPHRVGLLRATNGH
jgi:hypothetical protein